MGMKLTTRPGLVFSASAPVLDNLNVVLKVIFSLVSKCVHIKWCILLLLKLSDLFLNEAWNINNDHQMVPAIC